VQLFVDNLPSTELTLNEFGSCTVIANCQLYVTEERLPTDRRGRVRPTTTVRAPTTTVRHHDVAVQNDVAVSNDMTVQNNGAAAQPVVDIAAEPLNLLAGSSCR